MTKIRVMVFPGAHNLPLYLMDGLEIIYTKSRNEQIAAIQNGDVDIIHTSPDNLRLEDAKSLIPFLSGSVGPLSMMCTDPTIPFHTLAVDSAKSGFSTLAYDFLAKKWGSVSYDILEVGGTPQRLEAMKNNYASLAVMHPPFTQYAEMAGFKNLGRVGSENSVTLCGVYKNGSSKSLLSYYREQYRSAIEILSGEDGEITSESLIAEHIDLPSDLLKSVAKVMRAAIVSAGVDC